MQGVIDICHDILQPVYFARQFTQGAVKAKLSSGVYRVSTQSIGSTSNLYHIETVN